MIRCKNKTLKPGINANFLNVVKGTYEIPQLTVYSKVNEKAFPL